MTGKIGQYLRENDWLMAIKQRTGIPGGACEFDLPSYHYWLHRPAEDRMGQLAAWTGPLHPLRDGSAIILRILRESSKPQALTAPQGMFQQMLGGRSAQMLRVRLDPDTPCVPEISANKYVLNIRFLAQGDDPRLRTADWDVAFELAFCNL
jgi:cell division protein ZapD